MIVDRWPHEFTKQFGHVMPDTYVCFDTEYYYEKEKSIIFEIGHVFVENGEIDDRLGVVLNWTDHYLVPMRFVKDACQKLADNMEHPPRAANIDVMREEGLNPEKALEFYYKMFTKFKQRGIAFVAHNARRADVNMLNDNFDGFLEKTFDFPTKNLWDTGALIKATKGIDHEIYGGDRWLPKRGESLADYCARICALPCKGILWNLELCLREAGIDKLVDPSQMHQAETDSYCSHLLFEHLRKQVTKNNELSVEGLDDMIQELPDGREQLPPYNERIEQRFVQKEMSQWPRIRQARV